MVEEADLSYIIRDHDAAKLEVKKQIVQDAVDFINKKYGNIVTAEIKDQYRNMREMVEPHFHVVENAMKAMEMAGVVPRV